MNRTPARPSVATIVTYAAILLVCLMAPAVALATCGDGVLDGGEECDLGIHNGNATSCCTAACALRPSGEICRPAAGVCDVDDACDGANPQCPTALGRNVAVLGTATQSSALGPDTEAHNAIDGNTSGEFIDGSVTHTLDGNEDWWEVDLGSVKEIRLVRVWNRTDCCSDRLHDFHLILSDVPFESGELAATLAQSGVTAFFHPGSAATTTDFEVERSARYVRIQQLSEVLQLAEVQVFENSDDKVAAGTECRAAAGECDAAEQCDGFANDCPADVFLGDDVQCRASAGVCDPPEFCSGSATTCPDDARVAAGTECRASLGACDIPEVCDGTTAACPEDALHGSSVECRARTGFADLAETCDGVTAHCPVDAGRCAGYFDRSFSGGLVVTDSGLEWAYFAALAEQADGKVVAVGTGTELVVDLYHDHLVVARYRVDGSLDPSFGDAGIVAMAPLTGFPYNYALAVVIQDDGKIIAAAESYANFSGYNMVFVRFEPDGSLDASWGAGGVAFVEVDEGDGFTLTDLALDTNGLLIAAGSNWNDQPKVLRFDTTGQRDLSFGDAGVATHDGGVEVSLQDVIVQEDGKILLGGHSRNPIEGWDFVLLRFDADGTVDDGFGTGGVVISNFSTRDRMRTLILQPDGRIVAAGDTGPNSSHRTATLVRYLPDGSLDPDFGSGGVGLALHLSIRTEITGAARLPDGSIYTVRNWYDPGPPDAAVLVFTAFHDDGSVATEVGDAGFFVASAPEIAEVFDMIATRDGKLVAAGAQWQAPDLRFLVARFHGRCQDEAWLGYKAKAPKSDASGVAILGGNRLPPPWSVALDDPLLGEAPDGLENFEIGKAQHLLRSALVNTGAPLGDSDAAYVRYAARPAKQGAGAPVHDKFPKAARHLRRAWALENQLGTIHVVSQKPRSLLVPATANLDASPAPPEPADTFLCYAVKATKDVTDQTPDGGNGSGKLRRDLQVFVADYADSCALNRDGSPSFAGSRVAGSCLFDLGKPVELCNRVGMAAAAAPRATMATDVPEVEAGEGNSLLCYTARLSTKLTSTHAATTLGAAIGDAVSPKQARAATHAAKHGNPVLTTPGAKFPAPLLLDTKGQAIACLETLVVDVGVLP